MRANEHIAEETVGAHTCRIYIPESGQMMCRWKTKSGWSVPECVDFGSFSVAGDVAADVVRAMVEWIEDHSGKSLREVFR